MLIIRSAITIKQKAQLWDLWYKMSSRSRSTSRTRITVKTDQFASGEALDPVAFLSDILGELKSFDAPLAVILDDGSTKVSYGLATFVSKKYEISNDMVSFGFKKLNLRSLKAKIEFDIQVLN
jgi:hypothetical protein